VLVGRILFNAVKRISNQFPILKEARREVLEDLMDFEHAQEIINNVISGDIKVKEINTVTPSPFAFGLIMGGYSDVVKVEDKQEFLKRMHELVLAKINLKSGKEKLKAGKSFSYSDLWEEMHQQKESEKDEHKEKLKIQVWNLKRVPVYVKEELVKFIEFGNMRNDVLQDLKKYKDEISQNWPKELKSYILKKI